MVDLGLFCILLFTLLLLSYEEWKRDYSLKEKSPAWGLQDSILEAIMLLYILGEVLVSTETAPYPVLPVQSPEGRNMILMLSLHYRHSSPVWSPRARGRGATEHPVSSQLYFYWRERRLSHDSRHQSLPLTPRWPGERVGMRNGQNLLNWVPNRKQRLQ